jgi:hypothetical protein
MPQALNGNVQLHVSRGGPVAAQGHRNSRLDVYILDLDATLRESERTATSIARQLSLVPRSTAPPPPSRPTQIYETLATSRTLVDEAQRLLQAIRDGRQLLRELQAECDKLRRAEPPAPNPGI